MKPFIVCFSGKSNTGKTNLILKLISLFKKDGLKIGVVKHCPGGYEIEDKGGKDSWRFSRAGCDSIVLTGPEDAVAFCRIPDDSIGAWMRRFFYDYDVVFLEGFSGEKGLSRINVLRKGVSETLDFPEEHLVAVVADFPVKTRLPVFSHQEVEKLYKFLKERMGKGKTLLLEVNGKIVPVNPFVERMICGVVKEMVSCLKLEDREIEEIVLRIKTDKEAKL